MTNRFLISNDADFSSFSYLLWFLIAYKINLTRLLCMSQSFNAQQSCSSRNSSVPPPPPCHATVSLFESIYLPFSECLFFSHTPEFISSSYNIAIALHNSKTIPQGNYAHPGSSSAAVAPQSNQSSIQYSKNE